MGGDGGVIATQRKFVRGAKSDEIEEGKNVKRQQVIRTTTCALSTETLQEPIVCCELGNLFNKAAIITALLDKSLNSEYAYIRGLKDLKNLKLTPNPNYSSSQETNGKSPPKFICPITKMEMNGSLPFVVIWTTGYVLSEKALKEIGLEGLQLEYGPFSMDDVVRIAPLDEERESQIQSMISRRKRSKVQKRSSHEKADALNDNAGHSSATATDGKEKAVDADHHRSKKSKHHNESSAVTVVHPGNVAKAGAVSSASGVKNKSISHSAVLVRSAADSVSGQQKNSEIYTKLFHKDKEKDKHDRDLFMSVAGLR
eukprot:CAMPEP_0170081786 /NCGR_PEP_ID=MMETSP0019_2-20121128/17556_1 /TAXON_ID=98059 /ORGANISM="Dinobryon sp., Strain UTEXLB2267" /LENGTH=312 /DNA_ID=CAMNT_0010296369 /DNA_START=15 /DNA_END=950 /DNA_ORIENTATION=-